MGRCRRRALGRRAGLGRVNPELKVPATNGAAPNGSVVAFKLDEQNGAPVLVPAWVSRDLKSPVPPVVTSGVVFALSTGGRAVLYGLDAATGKELYSTGNQVTAARRTNRHDSSERPRVLHNNRQYALWIRDLPRDLIIAPV